MQKITFKNDCKVPTWLPEYKKEFRANSNPFFEKIINTDPFFKNKDVEIEYFQQGVGSIVAKITLNDGNIFVIKTTERVNFTISEIKSYEAMSSNGIKVPKVFAEGVIDEYPYFVMEYFNEGTLQDKLNNNEKDIEEIAEIKSEIFVELKKIKGTGYGWTIDYKDGVLKGNFSDIKSFLNEWFNGERTVKIANKHYPSINWREELSNKKEDIVNQNKDNISRFGSFDFQTAHFFATEPPTFFDSSPRLEPEYFDLAFALKPAIDISDNEETLKKALIDKYQEKFGEIDIDRFRVAMWLQTFRRATNLLLRPDEQRAKLGMQMLRVLAEENGLDKYMRQYF